MTTTLHQAVKTLLSGDATLAALATGGIHDPDSLGRPGLELADLCAGTPVIHPAVFIRWTTEAPFSAVILKARSVFAEVYFYQDQGYDTIRQMRERVFALLHQKRVPTMDAPAGDYLYAFVWAGDVLQQSDDSLGGASMERSRYEGHLIRR